MPEGHKTHFIAREHTEIFAGKKVSVSSPQGRFSVDAARIDGKRLSFVEAKGKQLFYHFTQNLILQIHLGRYGKFNFHSNPPPNPVGSVRMRMIGARHAVDLSGPSTCRIIDEELRLRVLQKIGPDPLGGGKAKDVYAKFSGSNKPIGALLLDQELVSGVGNIFRAELLFELGLDPLLKGSEINRDQFDRLWKSLVKMMKVGLKHGKIITVTAKEAGKPLAELGNSERFRVYGKSHCPRCNSEIAKPKIAGRTLYLCPNCQSQR